MFVVTTILFYDINTIVQETVTLLFHRRRDIVNNVKLHVARIALTKRMARDLYYVADKSRVRGV